MSLLSDALRKARAEQRRREIQAGASPPVLIPANAKAKAASFALLLVASLVSAGLTAGLVLFLRPTPPPLATTQVSEPPVKPPPTPLPTPTPVVAILQPTQNLQPTPPSPPPQTPEPLPTKPVTPTPSTRVLLLEGSVDGVHLHLDYLIFGAGRSFVSINGHEAREGDTVDGFVVETIQEDKVLLRGPGGAVILKIR